ncbi:MAG: winged helix-turn-helix domain-containing protein [Bacteroidales bacterium]|nr:winged helix-turn-helix domain-containing protein [Bacteroidales bacterium]
MIEIIGNNAGLVWTALSANNGQTGKGLKKATKLKDKDLFAALGWLAREGKIAIEDKGDDIVVTLL